MPEPHFSTIAGLWIILAVGLGGGVVGFLTLRYSPRHRRDLWYDDRNERRLRTRAKLLFPEDRRE